MRYKRLITAEGYPFGHAKTLYRRVYAHSCRRHVSIACREGILRDHFAIILNDIKFLNRQGIVTTLFHNMANRFANQKHFRTLAERLPETRIIRVDSDTDFYSAVLEQKPVFKLIFLERKYLTDAPRTSSQHPGHATRSRYDCKGMAI